jgi:hypothetical protein
MIYPRFLEIQMLLQRKECEIFADYFQFYLWDKGMEPVAPTDYTNEDTMRNLIKTAPHVVAILPRRNMTVKTVVEIHDVEPPLSPQSWDHIAEVSLHLPTGELEVHECTGGPVTEFRMTGGWYRVRAHYGGFDTIDESGLEGDDHYLVVLWPAPEGQLQIIRQWRPEG